MPVISMWIRNMRITTMIWNISMDILTVMLMRSIIINIVMKPWKLMSTPILMNIMYIQKRCIPTTVTITTNTVALMRSWRSLTTTDLVLSRR